MNTLKKLFAVFLTILTIVGTLIMPVSALSIGDEVTVTKTGNVAFFYDFTGYKSSQTHGRYGQYRKLSADGKTAYCVELGTDFSTGTGKLRDSVSLYNATQRKQMGLALVYGYTGTGKYGQGADIELAATQAVLWAIQLGSFNSDDTAYLNHAFITSGGHIGNTSASNATAAKEVYNKIKEQILAHDTMPIFANRYKGEAPNLTLKWDGSKYTATITDTNSVLAYYDFSYSGVEFKKSGNTLTISTTKELDGVSVEGERTSSKYLSASKYKFGKVGFVTETVQTVGCFVDDDPYPVYLKLTTDKPYGAVGVKKVDDTGAALSGVKIGVYSNSACTTKVAEITTNSSGIATYGYSNGEYTLEDGKTFYFKEISAPTGYDLSTQVVSATVKSNSITYAATNIVDNRQGKITLTKYDDADTNLGAGYVFGIFSDKACTKQVTTMTTNASGVATSGWLSAGTYYVQETAKPSTDTTHRLNTTVYTVTVTKGGTTAVNSGKFVNDRATGVAEVIKMSEDEVVEGIQFRLYGTADIGTKVDMTAKTNSKGVATFSNVLIGTYTIEEVDPLDIYVTPKSQTVTVKDGQTASVTFNNILRRGNAKVIKTSEDGIVEGLTFSLSGTLASGKKISMTAVTDEDGIATFNDVPVGTYTISESKTPTRYVKPRSQTITVEEGQTVTVTFHNVLKRGSVRVIKSATDNFVEGLTFRLYGTSLSGEEIDMTAITDKDGVARFNNIPISSPIKPYTIEEVDTPERYTVPMSQKVVVGEDAVVTVNFHNALKLDGPTEIVEGSIRIYKIDAEGNKLSDVSFLLEYSTDGGETYQPVFYRDDRFFSPIGGCRSKGLEDGILVTDENGLVWFTGLHTSTQTEKILYRVTETATQEGYQLLADYAFEGELTADGVVDVKLTVVNTHGYLLPATGGTGFYILLVFGVVTMLSAAWLGITAIKTKKRISISH